MKKICLIFLLAISSLAFVGCSKTPDRTIPPSYDQTMDQQTVDEIKGTASDTQATDTALDATDQAIDDLNNVDFGEAPAVE